MMQIPISLSDISLLLASISLILLVTVEIFIPVYGQTKLLVNQKRLKKLAIASSVSVLFFIVITVLSNDLIAS